MMATFFEMSYTLITILLLAFFFYKSFHKGWGRSQQILWWITFGSIFNLYSLSWLYTVYPLIWMPEGILQLIGIALLHIIISLASGLCFFVVGYVVTLNIKSGTRPFLVGLSLVVAEILRSFIISLLYLGDGTTVDLHFTAGTIGNALSSTPLVELAYYGGTFALTFLCGYILYALISLPLKKSLIHFVAVSVILLLTHAYVPLNTPDKDLVIGLITTDIPTSEGENLKEKIRESNQMVASFVQDDKTERDIIVLPEDTRFLSSLSEEARTKLLRQHPDTLLVDGTSIRQDDNLMNLSLFYQTKTGALEGRGKELLLPFNEYIPYALSPIFRVIIGGQFESYKKDHTYTPIHSPKTISFNGVRVATIICSEILSFRVLENIGDEHPSVVFYQSRLNVFNNNPWFLMHLRSFSKVAAAQLRTTIISSNNYAPSYMITGRGKIVGEVGRSTSYSTVFVKTSGEVILKGK